MNNQLEIDSVFLNFADKKVLNGIHLTIKNNEIVGLLGRNGSGKSCFLKILTGAIKPQFKHIRFNQIKIDNLYQIKGLINYLPQHTFHPKNLCIRNLLSFYAIEKAHFYKEYPFIKNLAERRIYELSGGLNRIIEVLIVLESNSKFTILDEPFSHVMPLYIDLIKNAIKRIKKRKGILITDHQYRNVLKISDKLFLLKDGVLNAVSNEMDLKEMGYIL